MLHYPTRSPIWPHSDFRVAPGLGQPLPQALRLLVSSKDGVPFPKQPPGPSLPSQNLGFSTSIAPLFPHHSIRRPQSRHKINQLQILMRHHIRSHLLELPRHCLMSQVQTSQLHRHPPIPTFHLLKVSQETTTWMSTKSGGLMRLSYAFHPVTLSCQARLSPYHRNLD